MSDRSKKIVFAIVFVILSIGIGIGLYEFFFKPLTTPTPVVTTPPGQQGQLPQAGTGTQQPGQITQPGTLNPSGSIPVVTAPNQAAQSNVTLLRDAVTQALSASANGTDARFYSPDDGRFYRVNADGSITALGDKQFFNVQDVSWANQSDKAILDFPDGTNVYYDFDSKRQATLPSHWGDFSFAPNDQQVVAKSIGLDPNSRFLITTSPDGNEPKAIEELGNNADKVTLDWSPNNQVVGFSQTGNPQAEGGQEVYLIGQNHENFKSLIVPGRGFLPNWSPTGDQLLYSVYHERDDLKPSLWVTDASGDSIGQNRRALNLQTWADKCAWRNENELICGVPQQLDTGAGLQRANFTSVPDDVYDVNLKTGVSTKISTADETYPINKPIVSADKSKLMFTDAVTGRLYSYKLP